MEELRIFRMTFLALLLLFSFVVVASVHALPADSMWIEPPTLDFGGSPVGTKFNVTIWLNVATPTNSWQFYLVYNAAHLNAVRCDYTGSGKSQWSGTELAETVVPSFGFHNSTHGYVVHGEVLKNSGENTGAGSLSWVEFEIIQVPPEGQTLASELRLDLVGAFDSKALTKDYVSIPLDYGNAIYVIPEFPFPILLFAFVIVVSGIALVFKRKISQKACLRRGH